MTIKEVVSRWLDAAMPHRQGPQIGKVLQVKDGTTGGVCGVQVKILKPGSLKETERIIDDVPAPMIWHGPAGSGFYNPLEEGSLVVIGYVDFNAAYPYIQGIWGEFSGLTKLEDLFKELDKNVAVLSAMTTVMGGAPITEPGNGSPSALQAALAGSLAGKQVGNFTVIESTVVK